MQYVVLIALVAPGAHLYFEPPVGNQTMAIPYADRLKVELKVREDETLEDVMWRVITAVAPDPLPSLGQTEAHPAQPSQFAWFYEPLDASGLDGKRWTFTTELTTVDGDGRAWWNRKADQIPYGDVVRSGQRGLLRGDPLKPYLVLEAAQGGTLAETAWEGIQLAWMVMGGLLTTGTFVNLTRDQVDRLRHRLKGARVVESHHVAWSERGGGPSDLRKTVECRAWPLDDFRVLMDLETNDEARGLLELFGCVQDENGNYVVDDSTESKILGLTESDIADLVRVHKISEDTLGKRLKILLDTGELPEEPPWKVDEDD